MEVPGAPRTARPSSVCPDCLAEVDAASEVCGACGYVRPRDGWLPDPLTGLILGGRYRLEGRLGTGGMASVFRATRIGALGGHVAVKVLAPRFSRTVIARRFEREAQVVARLTNPHIVRIYDFDTFAFPDPSGRHELTLYYIAMELIEGATLGQLLRAQGKVNFLWGIDVLRQVARGLEEAHAQGIVHRDLKPSNLILVQQRGSTHVKILDFGIAALSVREQEAAGAEKLTQTGFVSGTPDYMAPEQAVGDPNVGPAADMFALGVIAFEMFAGRKPFEGATMESLLARVTKPAPGLRDVVQDPSFPPDLFRIVDRLLARNPSERYQHAGELLDDLGRYPTLQTTPDFVPPAELLRRYATASGPSLLTAEPALAGADPQRAGTPSSTRTIAAGPPGTGNPWAAATPGARAKSSAWIWIVALLIVGGGGAAVAYFALSAPSVAPTEPTAGRAPQAPTEPAITAKAFDVARLDARIPLGDPGLVIALGIPERLPALYAPLPISVALEHDGRRVAVRGGTLIMTLRRDGRPVATITALPLGDARLGFMLPPRPLPEAYDLALHLDGEAPRDLRLGLDATNGQLTVR